MTNDVPTYKFQPNHISDIAAEFRCRLEETELPPGWDKKGACDRRHEWFNDLLRQGTFYEWEHMILQLLKTCPDSKYIDKGVDNAIKFLTGRCISDFTMAATLVFNLNNMYRFDANRNKNGIGYYYETYTFIAFTYAALDWLMDNSEPTYEREVFSGF